MPPSRAGSWSRSRASASDVGGFKEVVAAVTGAGVFAKLKFESGVHRVQRVPVTECGRPHPHLGGDRRGAARADEVDVQIEDKDLKIDIYRSSGAGGQHVNTTDSAVRITHLPIGLVVTCQDERSQHKNKAKAMQVLRARLYEKMRDEAHGEEAEARKAMVGSGDRSERIRTYNFPQGRVTDHRIGLTLHKLPEIIEGTALGERDRRTDLRGRGQAARGIGWLMRRRARRSATPPTALAETSDTARLDAEVLMAHALGVAALGDAGAAHGRRGPEDFAMFVGRRAAHEPVAYITGTQEFYGRGFRVSPDVLIPRGDSEVLVERAIAARPDATRVLDCGTGSGALLLTCLMELPAAGGVGIDRSQAALEVARGNAAALGLEDRAAMVRADWTVPGWADALHGPFDLVLANPPYVETGAVLAADVRDHEPPEALFAGPDGLDDYRVLVPQMPGLLAANGIALFEIGATQASAVMALAEAAGLVASLHRDLGGRPTSCGNDPASLNFRLALSATIPKSRENRDDGWIFPSPGFDSSICDGTELAPDRRKMSEPRAWMLAVGSDNAIDRRRGSRGILQFLRTYP